MGQQQKPRKVVTEKDQQLFEQTETINKQLYKINCIFIICMQEGICRSKTNLY